MTHRVELLIIGNEILSGHTLDTNSHWLAQRLFELDLPVNHIQVIGDYVTQIASILLESLSRGTRLLIISGGLGPTFDDLTAEGLAMAAKKTLELNSMALRMVTARYEELKAQGLVESAKITPAREKMARLPQGAEPLPNSVGSAPGIKFILEKMLIYCLPGVPDELHAIFLESVVPEISKLTSNVLLQDLIVVPALDESVLAPLLVQVMHGKDGLYLKSLPRSYQTHQPLRVLITVSSKSKTKARTMLNNAIDDLHKLAKGRTGT